MNLDYVPHQILSNFIMLSMYQYLCLITSVVILQYYKLVLNEMFR